MTTLHSFNPGNPAALRLSSSCCRPFSGSKLSALPSVKASLSADSYSGPTAGSDRCPSRPLLTKQPLRDSGSSDSGHRTLALNGLYSSRRYVQGENNYFWWESCGKRRLPVDVLGKGVTKVRLRKRVHGELHGKRCKYARLFTTEAQRHAENQEIKILLCASVVNRSRITRGRNPRAIP